MLRNLTWLVRIRNFNAFQISQYSIYISQPHYKIESHKLTSRSSKGREKGRKGWQRGGKIPSHLSVQSPTIIQPLKLLSSSYKKSYFIHQCPDDDYKQKKSKEEMEKTENATLPKTVFSTHGWEGSFSKCLSEIRI